MSNNVDRIMARAFGWPRTPRSAEYKAGVRAALERFAADTPLACPYAAGTVHFDAWHAGVAEGHQLWCPEPATVRAQAARPTAPR